MNYLLSFAIKEINKMGVIFRFKIQKFAVAPVDKDLIKKSLAPQKSTSEMDISGSQDDYEEIEDSPKPKKRGTLIINGNKYACQECV
jgi:hypothetical protein